MAMPAAVIGVMTTTDGTIYYFGKAESSNDSAWTVPVCGNATTAYSAPGGVGSAGTPTPYVTRAWRWNLDKIIDTHSNTITFRYDKKTNYYGLNNGQTRTSYICDSYLTSIEYGSNNGSAATARVVSGTNR
jgi:hypothetical protein